MRNGSIHSFAHEVVGDGKTETIRFAQRVQPKNPTLESGESPKHRFKLVEDAAWYYPSPLDAAKPIAGDVALWIGVEVLT